MGRRMCAVLLTLVLAGSLALQARAAGEIRVTLDYGDGEVTGGSVLLCQAAYPEGEHYRLTEVFGSGLVKREDAVSDELARWLGEIALREMEPRELEPDGSVCFGNLEEGLYLLVQGSSAPGAEDFSPILIPVPSSGHWQLSAWPQQKLILAQFPRTGDETNLCLAAVLMAASGLGLLACFAWRRRKEGKAG